MTDLKKIKKQYPDEWILVEVTSLCLRRSSQSAILTSAIGLVPPFTSRFWLKEPSGGLPLKSARLHRASTATPRPPDLHHVPGRQYLKKCVHEAAW
jgi:hypothetical protein